MPNDSARNVYYAQHSWPMETPNGSTGNMYYPQPNQPSDSKQTALRILDLMATFLLEVMGGAGAVWGCAENMGVRFGPINDEWRAVCWCTFILCLWRWVAREAYGVKSHDGEIMAVFLLDVMGGAGAMWGCLEIAGYRVNYPKDCHEVQTYRKADYSVGTFEGVGGAWGIQYEYCGNTYSECRIICAFVFVLCALSWQRLVPAMYFQVAPEKPFFGLNLEFYSRTFLLEVMGGAGALWGFSEICGRSSASLRLGWGDIYFGQRSFDFWRICCLITFILCSIRWVMLRLIPGPPDGWNNYVTMSRKEVELVTKDKTDKKHDTEL